MSADGASGGGLTLRIWGAGGSAPTGRPERVRYGGDTVCFEIRRDTPGAVPLIVDLGSGACALGRSLSAEARAEGRPARAEILLSHLHLDHIIGAPFFGPLYDRSACVTLRSGLSDDPAYVRDALARFAAPPYFPVRPLDMGAVTWAPFRPGAAFEAAGLTVTPIRLNHPGGCCGFRIESPEGAIAIIGDHEHGDPEIDAAIARAVEGASLMLYDAPYDEEEYACRVGWGHSTWEKGVALALKANVGEALFYHHQPEMDDAGLALRDARVQAAWSGARLAVQGMTWRLSQGAALPV